MVSRYLTSAGSPHLTVPSRFRYAGQSRSIIVASVDHMRTGRREVSGCQRFPGAAPRIRRIRSGWLRRTIRPVLPGLMERRVLSCHLAIVSGC
jgi:hypothetical protein